MLGREHYHVDFEVTTPRTFPAWLFTYLVIPKNSSKQTGFAGESETRK